MSILAKRNRNKSYYEELESGNIQRRKTMILAILSDNQSRTAIEISKELQSRFNDGNGTRDIAHPRLKQLMQDGFVIEDGSKKCQYTNKTVTLYRLKSREEIAEENENHFS